MSDTVTRTCRYCGYTDVPDAGLGNIPGTEYRYWAITGSPNICTICWDAMTPEQRQAEREAAGITRNCQYCRRVEDGPPFYMIDSSGVCVPCGIARVRRMLNTPLADSAKANFEFSQEIDRLVGQKANGDPPATPKIMMVDKPYPTGAFTWRVHPMRADLYRGGQFLATVRSDSRAGLFWRMWRETRRHRNPS